MSDNEIYPINLLTDELKSDEVETRIKTMKRIKTVAQALGPERTRSELLPFLNGSTEDEDEILVTLSEELGGFVPLVGGPNYASCILDPLESLAAVEETVVRDKAVQSIGVVIDALTDSLCTEKVIPLIKRLSEGDWFTSRVSACGIFAASYPKINSPQKKKELRDLYESLCGDDTPMVRRSAASNMGHFAATMEKEHLLGNFINHFKALTNDDQDSVRLLAIENCSMIGKLLSEEENKTYLLPIVRLSMDDRSWRVRNSIAKDFAQISKEMGSEIINSELRKAFENLLQDSEAEVRAVATKNISAFVDLLDINDFVTGIVPLLDGLSQDSAPNVRGALSEQSMELAPKLGQELTQRYLLPIYLNFLRDDIVDVRLNILKRIDLLTNWLPSMESTLLPAISELSRDLQWRIRQAVIQTFPALAASMGPLYFREHCLSIYLSLFTDMVAEVRHTTTIVLKDLLEAMGNTWVLENIIPKLTQIYDNSQVYQERINVLNGVKFLATKNADESLLNELASLALRGAHDKTPNVRLTAVMAIQELSKFAESATVNSQLRPCLTELQNDDDSDVKFYTDIALESTG